jgi:hypothetical protein
MENGKGRRESQSAQKNRSNSFSRHIHRFRIIRVLSARLKNLRVCDGYELTRDRLIDPIQKSNIWFEPQRKEEQQQQVEAVRRASRGATATARRAVRNCRTVVPFSRRDCTIRVPSGLSGGRLCVCVLRSANHAFLASAEARVYNKAWLTDCGAMTDSDGRTRQVDERRC